MMRIENTVRRGNLLLLLGLRAGSLKWASLGGVVGELWRRRKRSSQVLMSVLSSHVVLAWAMVEVARRKRRWRWGTRIRLAVRGRVWWRLL